MPRPPCSPSPLNLVLCLPHHFPACTQPPTPPPAPQPSLAELLLPHILRHLLLHASATAPLLPVLLAEGLSLHVLGPAADAAQRVQPGAPPGPGSSPAAGGAGPMDVDGGGSGGDEDDDEDPGGLPRGPTQRVKAAGGGGGGGAPGGGPSGVARAGGASSSGDGGGGGGGLSRAQQCAARLAIHCLEELRLLRARELAACTEDSARNARHKAARVAGVVEGMEPLGWGSCYCLDVDYLLVAKAALRWGCGGAAGAAGRAAAAHAALGA